jgi:formyltetrahydrofolate-dependent phosphoribosylglycinamide formyltransferase
MPAPDPNRTLTSVEEIAAWRDELQAEGKRLVFTNGCFDLLHPGHTRYLQQARDLGDALVIGMNSDRSVRELKGPTRPINCEEDRAEVLRALRSVDAVVVYDDKRATHLIEVIRPHIYSKGGDYTVDSLDKEERQALEKAGADIRILPLVAGRSTTNTIKRMSDPLLKLAFLGSGAGTNFQAVIDAVAEGRLAADIVCAISDNAESKFLERARTAGIPEHYVDPGADPKRFPATAQQEVYDLLTAANPDVIVLAGFMRLLKDPVISAFSGRIINIHPSLLPKYPGATAIADALAAGESETGATIHHVTADLDAGPVIAQERVAIAPDETLATLRAKINAVEQVMIVDVLKSWLNNSFQTRMDTNKH